MHFNVNDNKNVKLLKMFRAYFVLNFRQRIKLKKSAANIFYVYNVSTFSNKYINLRNLFLPDVFILPTPRNIGWYVDVFESQIVESSGVTPLICAVEILIYIPSLDKIQLEKKSDLYSCHLGRSNTGVCKYLVNLHQVAAGSTLYMQ